jgi:hypothetical protein
VCPTNLSASPPGARPAASVARAALTASALGVGTAATRFRELVSTFAAVSASISIIVAFSFIPSSIAVFAVREREISAKHQQILAGTGLRAYWLSNFCFDVATFFVPWTGGLACVWAFGIGAFPRRCTERRQN